MKLTVPREVAPNPLYILRRAGYASFVDPNTKEESFVLRLGTGYYPRFHIYVEATAKDVTFNLHLDQKQPSYGSGPSHNGEYEGPTVERELKRLETWVRAARPKDDEDDAEETPQKQKKTSLVDWLFG